MSRRRKLGPITRDRWFESGFLQRRVNKLSVPLKTLRAVRGRGRGPRFLYRLGRPSEHPVRDSFLTAPEYPVAWCGWRTGMDSVSAEATQAWFAAKVAVALSPILIFLTADVIEWLPRALFGGARRWLLGSGPETARHEPAGVAARRGKAPDDCSPPRCERAKAVSAGENSISTLLNWATCSISAAPRPSRS